MKLNLTIFAVLNLYLGFHGQTPQKTYYDFAGRQIKESFFTNQKGEKTGLYKSFAENGVLQEEINYQNGNLQGVYKLYDGAPLGKAFLSKMETYKDNLRHGEAQYYLAPSYSIMAIHGTYLNDKKDGVWTYIDPIEGATLTDCMYLKYSQTYKAGELISEDSKAFYYPSGKLCLEDIQKEGKIVEQKCYHPNGKLKFSKLYNANEEPISIKGYYDNGKRHYEGITSIESGKRTERTTYYYENGSISEIITKVGDVETDYQGYNEDGTKNEKYLKLDIEKANKSEKAKIKDSEATERSKTRINQLSTYITQGDRYDSEQAYDKARQEYGSAKNMGNEHWSKNDTAFYRFYTQKIEFLTTKLNEMNLMMNGGYTEFNTLKRDVSDQDAGFEAQWQKIDMDYILKQNNGQEKVVKFIYEKGKVLFNDLIEGRKKERNFQSKLSLGKKIQAHLAKMDELIIQDKDKINKKLENAVTPSEIKTIFWQ